jgi:hypothetical protein
MSNFDFFIFKKQEIEEKIKNVVKYFFCIFYRG